MEKYSEEFVFQLDRHGVLWKVLPVNVFSETNSCKVKLVHTCRSHPKSPHEPSGEVAEHLNIFHLVDTGCGFADLQLLEMRYIWIKSTVDV